MWDDPVAAPPPAVFPGIPQCSQAAGPVKGASHPPSSSANAAYLTCSQDFFLFWSKATSNQSREDEREADAEAWLEVEVIRMLETKSKQKTQLLRSPHPLISGWERDKNVSVLMTIFEEKSQYLARGEKVTLKLEN